MKEIWYIQCRYSHNNMNLLVDVLQDSIINTDADAIVDELDTYDICLPGRSLDMIYPDHHNRWSNHEVLRPDKKDDTLQRKLYNAANANNVPAVTMDKFFKIIDNHFSNSPGYKTCGTYRSIQKYSEERVNRIKSVYLIKINCQCQKCLQLWNVLESDRIKNINKGIDGNCHSKYFLHYSLTGFSLKKFPRKYYSVVSEFHFFDLKDLLKTIVQAHHQQYCSNCQQYIPKIAEDEELHYNCCIKCKKMISQMKLADVYNTDIDFSIDGIPGAKSNVSSTTCFGLRIFEKCNYWYPLGILYRKNYSNTRMLSHRHAFSYIVRDVIR